MKVALIGSGPASIFVAHEFEQLGAEVILFAQRPLGGGVERLSDIAPWASMEFSWKELVPPSLMGEVDAGLELVPTVEEYKKKFFHSFMDQVGKKVTIFPHRALRVSKCFLAPSDELANEGRMGDFFRVVYAKDSLERYELFDLVVDASGVFHRPLPLGAGESLALNEAKLAPAKSWDIFKNMDGQGEVCLVGSGSMVALYCVIFFRLFPRGKLTLITSERTPFAQLEREGRHKFLVAMVKKIMDESFLAWKKSGGERANFCIYSTYSVVSLDKMEDREGIFVTIESPSWENDGEDKIKTILVNRVLGATGFYQDGVPSNLQTKEEGFFPLAPRDIPQVICQIPPIVKKAQSFFREKHEMS